MTEMDDPETESMIAAATGRMKEESQGMGF
jgi:hypothetical protein